MKFQSSMLVMALALALASPQVSAFTFAPAPTANSPTFKLNEILSFSRSAGTRTTNRCSTPTTNTRLYMDLENDNKNAFFVDPPGTGVGNTSSSSNDNDNEVEKDSTATATVTKQKSLSPDVSKLLAEAKALKARAEKERLEAERMTTLLIIDKISALEKKLAKLQSSEKEEKNKQKKILEIQEQIFAFRQQMEAPSSSKSSSSSRSSSRDSTSDSIAFKTIDASAPPQSSSPLVTSKRTGTSIIPERKMPQDLFDKRLESYQTFSKDVKKLFATAVDVEDPNDGETIIRKCYNIEMKRKSDGNIAPLDLLDVANAQAGFETLPPPVKDMVVESVGMEPSRNLNHTAVVEKLVQAKKIKRTNDGGVEFSMQDSYEDNERSVRDREFTEEEVDSAVKLYENLPPPMKTILAKAVGETIGSNSTVIVTKMVEQKKLLPSEDGVEFVVFGTGEEETAEERESANYVRNLLPEVTRKEDQAPSEEDAMAFFSEVLGKKTFNPSSKPESIPGGFVIRGENNLKNGDDLVKALDAKLKASSVLNKLNYCYMKDPTAVTQEQFEADDFELPVIVITGPDLSPDTNRFVKPVVTAFGGLSIASFAVATCLSTDLEMTPELVESMTSPLVFAMLGTQVAHEAAHQIVAFKDKVCWLL